MGVRKMKISDETISGILATRSLRRSHTRSMQTRPASIFAAQCIHAAARTSARQALQSAAVRTTLFRHHPRQATLPTTDFSAQRAFSQTPTRQKLASAQTVYSTGGSCPGCGTPIPPAVTPVCPNCANLLPPPPPATTYYDLFEIAPPSFAIDAAQLKRAFLTLQQKVHPDMYSGRGESEDWAKAWSGRVNDAYKALTNERERAEYLVSSLPALGPEQAASRTEWSH